VSRRAQATQSTPLANRCSAGTCWWEKCRLHADATRDGISQLLRLRREAGGRLEWHVIANNRGNFNKIAFGPSKQVIPGVFLYLGVNAERGRQLM
jgi:hypothetical protein